MRSIGLLVMIASLAAAQDPPPKVAESDRPIIETFKFVLAPVTVTDRSGSFVPGLTVYDFRLFDNGKPQRITEDMASHPISMVVVIQANSDVEKVLPQIQKLSSVFETLVLGPDDEIAVLAFDHRIQTLTGFTSDPVQIDQAFKKLKPGSYTAALNDATMEGINLLRNRPTSRRRIMVQIAENRDKGSGMSVREGLTAADFAEVYIYSIDISQLVAALTSKAQPNRPSTLPPGAETPAHGYREYRDHGIADQHGQLGSRAQRRLRRSQGSFRAGSAGCVHALHRRAPVFVQNAKATGARRGAARK